MHLSFHNKSLNHDLIQHFYTVEITVNTHTSSSVVHIGSKTPDMPFFLKENNNIYWPTLAIHPSLIFCLDFFFFNIHFMTIFDLQLWNLAVLLILTCTFICLVDNIKFRLISSCHFQIMSEVVRKPNIYIFYMLEWSISSGIPNFRMADIDRGVAKL